MQRAADYSRASSARRTSLMSCHINHFGLPTSRESFLSRYDGWNIGITLASFLYGNHLPRIRLIGSLTCRIPCTAVVPARRISLGLMKSICASKYGLQAAASSLVGTRFCGGRHLTILQMYVSRLRSIFADSKILSSSLPA